MSGLKFISCQNARIESTPSSKSPKKPGPDWVNIVSHVLIILYCSIEAESDHNTAFQRISVSVSVRQAAL